MLDLAILFAAATAAAAPSAAPPPQPCASAEYRQLDFWIGEWNVFQVSDNTPAGTSRIESVMGGCGIGEHYEALRAPGGAYSGTSYSGYDRKDGQWHQMYVDTNGNLAWYSGKLEGANMVLHAPGKKGSLQTMEYRPHADGSVEQIGTISTDGGATWQPAYDYIYRKK
jgi:hypothetical protein